MPGRLGDSIAVILTESLLLFPRDLTQYSNLSDMLKRPTPLL